MQSLQPQPSPGRVVVLGGTFDPVHHGHLIVARHVAERLGAPRVVLMPASAPPHKKSPAACPKDRLSMLQRAINGDTLFQVSTLELDRPGPSYTYHTLTALRQHYGDAVEIVWVIGLDMLIDLHKWYRSAEVADMARLVTVARPPMPADLDAKLQPLGQTLGPERTERLRQDILLDAPLIDIASTDIRRRVAHGLSVRYLIPKAVADYIEQHGLYRTGSASGS